MNFEIFQGYKQAFHFEEVKIIGKEVCVDGNWLHIVGMGRKAEGVFLYIFEEQPPWDENQIWKPNRTNRERMLDRESEYSGNALHINKIKIGNDMFELQGGSCGSIVQQDSVEAYFFFQQMMDGGWSILDNSHFYQLDWKCMALAELKLADMYDNVKNLPELSGEVEQLAISTTSRTHIVQVPVKLECGKTNELTISMENGEEIIIYISKVSVTEMLKEAVRQFEDKDYHDKMLQHISQEQFEEIKEDLLGKIEVECPKGMGYFTIEYECTKDNINAQFYDAQDLDSVPQPKENATSFYMSIDRPEQKIGPHGLRNRCTTVKYAVPADTMSMNAELFMLLETIPEKVLVYDKEAEKPNRI